MKKLNGSDKSWWQSFFVVVNILIEHRLEAEEAKKEREEARVAKERLLAQVRQDKEDRQKRVYVKSKRLTNVQQEGCIF